MSGQALSSIDGSLLCTHRMAKVLKTNGNNESLSDEYERIADSLLEWIRKSVPSLESRLTDHSISTVQKKLEEFRQYRLQKPQRCEQKSRLEKIAQQAIDCNHLTFAGKTLTDINKAWKSLESVERAFEEWLLSEMVKLETSENIFLKAKQPKLEVNSEPKKLQRDGKPPISKKREELTKAVHEARKKLENIGWKSSALNSSKSVANLRDHIENNDESVQIENKNPSDEIRRSISLSDLSVTPHRRVLPIRRINIDSEESAPLWNRAKLERERLSSQQQVGLMRKSVSNVALNRSEPTPQIKTMPRFKSQGLWSAAAATPSSRNSGRLSAPLQRQYNSRRNLSNDPDLSDDNSSSSSENCPRALRPGTPPKPNILRQIRRSSTSQVVVHNNEMNSGMQPKPTRRLWDKFALRSAKSEYNLNFAGRETPQNRYHTPSSNSSLWTGQSPETVYNDKFDLAATNPATIPLSHELCHHIVDELNQIATYAKKIYHRSAAEGNTILCNILVDGISKAYVNLSTVINPPLVNGGIPSNESTINNPDNMVNTMKLLQQYSDRLLSLVEQRMTKDNQKKN
ncbi:alpha-actinin: sarcomeric-like isoform X4 [Dinothrombium tinctorium]|uniref:Alpha-actinin: sarcomeric-like isoform X4 n=1 Tax=Dinothrombium tinctorium TaxID=1965070 RepID=A0A3S3PE90_9ACAR|nr:alpha-actinin: sarcomeric-like isoform X4 [Dinothrombium tinctorium]RWS14606.1 alpha-actinin: sarcomeric-like isoform X4 [Dinothrombium tinctorium]